jgi:serine/threonine-protein phosphatase 2A regulatory subunit B''
LLITDVFSDTEPSSNSPRFQKPPLEQTKKDSGIHLDEQLEKVESVNHQDLFSKSAPSQIPQFHYPYGRPDMASNSNSLNWESGAKDIFGVSFTNITGRSLDEREFVKVTKMCGLNTYLNSAFFRQCKGDDEKANFASFAKFWSSVVGKYFSEESKAFAIIKQGSNTFLTRQDISVVVQDVTLNHPGLEFLSSMPVFQNRYTETVVSRLFYSKRQNWNNKMSLAEFKKSRFFSCLNRLEEVDDVNTVSLDLYQTQDIFSYQHFYVIYCKFWELDRDHDMVINLGCLLRYDGGSMTPAILKRVMAGCGKPLEKGTNAGLMTYDDFIWFILSVEDKRTPQAIEYWFRCLDLDGDGVISLYELSFFYEDQYERMLCSRVSDVWKFDDFVCSLMDLVKPEKSHIITLQDLKRCGSSNLFFDMIFDLRKYDSYIRRIDPMFREIDDMYIDNLDGTRTKLE